MQQNVEPIDDDIVMARWLQSAGLQHLASPKTSPNRFLKQGLGMQRVEDEEKQCRWGKNLNLEGESEPYSPTASFYAPELRASFGAGLLDLNAMDTGLLSEHTLSESSEQGSLSPILYGKVVDYQDTVINKQNNVQTDPSTNLPANEKERNLKDSNLVRNKVMRTLSEPLEATPVKHTLSEGFDDGYDTVSSQQNKGQADTSTKFPANEKESSSKDGNMARIKVVVRKRPLNKKELSRKDYDVIKVCDNACLTVHEPKQKVDLTAYVEKHEFCFDEVLDENVTNDEVYHVTVKPIVPTLFQRTKATCFAYGQTGSGKTFTMQPLPIRAAEEIIILLSKPSYQNQNLKLWVSYFEIYGGKLFDLLRDRRCCR